MPFVPVQEMAPLDGDVKSLALSPSFFLINSSATDKNINCSMFEKNALYLSVNIFSTKILMGTLFLRLLLKNRPPFSVVIRATRRTSRLQGKWSTSISQLYFKTMSIGPAPGIEPATSRSAVKRSTD